MKKIPSVFVRDWNGDRGRVLPQVEPGCEWVLEGLGVATRKWDGAACLIQHGRFYKRHDVKENRIPPEGFMPADEPDPLTGHWPGWVPVGDGPDDQWHREAWKNSNDLGLDDGTYELLGPKVQGNTEHLSTHVLVPHGVEILEGLPEGEPRTFESLKEYLFVHPIEGIVFMRALDFARTWDRAKIKRRDFGLPWPLPSVPRFQEEASR